MFKPYQMLKRLGYDVFMNPHDSDPLPLKDKKLEKERKAWYDFNDNKQGLPIITQKFAEVLGQDPKKPNYDAVIFQRADVLTIYSLAMMVRQTYNIPVIQETDDYVFEIPHTNPAIQSYFDKPTEYRNENQVDPLTVARMSLGSYDGYIVTTPFLKRFYENYSPTYICPNSIDLSEREQLPKEKHDDFRIIFSSSATHTDGLKFLVPVIDRFLTEHEDATFYHYWSMPKFFKGKPYEKRIKMMKWERPEKYWKYINSISPDVCLAPLTDVMFNRAKSNLRLLEYWTSGNNAVIASPVEPYVNTIKNGKNGFLAKSTDEWYEKLEYLYHNRQKLDKLGKEGYKTVKKHYNLEKNARYWADAVNSIIRGYSPDKQSPKQYQPGW
jgi:glycosyltransferase involved in cell wall biosynthesis